MFKRVALIISALFLLTACGDEGESTVTCAEDCTRIPDPVCDGAVQISALGGGQCVEGTCQWVPIRTDCAFGCEAGACSAPPAPFCRGTVATGYDAAGSCEAATGNCSYNTNETDCAASGLRCVSGTCQVLPGDPCAGVVCNAPISA